MAFSQYTNKTVKEVFGKLNTSMSGLSKKEALLRQKKYGPNEVLTKGVRAIDIFLRQCKSPFFYLLFIAGVAAFLIGEKIDGALILIFIFINITIGFVQEFRAEKTISLLKNIISQKIKVVREGRQEVIEKKHLVPGDMVVLFPGDIVPAELRLVSMQNFLVDESVLTGESLPVLKTNTALAEEEKEIFKSSNMLFTGTSVISGAAEGVVVAIGEDTALGEIITSATEKRPQGRYEKDIIYFCRLILRIVVVTVVVIFLLNIILKGTANFFEFLLFFVALVVSILPEALPAIVILALSRGSIKMAKENVVVKRLSAIEDLGNIEILCTDKTGTITQNKLSLERIVAPDKDKAMVFGLLGAEPDIKKDHGVNFFDSAIFTRANYAIVSEVKKYTIASRLPFDSFRMRSSVLAKNEQGEKILVVKGAPEVMFKLCVEFEGSDTKNEIKKEIAREGQDGKRVLLAAFKKVNKESITKEDEKGLTFLGYFVFEDPLKSTAEEAIRLSKKMGIQIKIITGDSKEVAGFVAKKIGLISDASQVPLGEDLEKMHSDEFNNVCQDSAVFARVSPDIKHKIIKSLQKSYEVGFLGEGINDVPALKQANIGIAVFEATDVAKEASDVVLLKKDLRVIVNGIKDGRAVFSNINKYIKCTLSSNFGNFYSIATISLFINFLPMLPVQILLANLLSDFPLVSIVTDAVDVEELRKPKAYQLHNMLPLIISLGLVSTVFDFIFLFIFYKAMPAHVQTLWFIESVITEIFLIFIIRTRRLFWKAKKPSVALVSFTVVALCVILTLPFTGFGQQFFHFASVPFYGLFMVFLILIGYLVLSELVKLVYFHYWKLKNSVVR